MEQEEPNRQIGTVFSRTARIAVSTMLASAMCIPVPAIAQEQQANGSAEAAAQAGEGEVAAPVNDTASNAEATDAQEQATAQQSIEATEATPVPQVVSTGEDAASTLKYSIDEDGNATITGTTDTETPRDLVIPKQIDGHPVTAIGHYAFRVWDPDSNDASWMLSIFIPDSVKTIGGNAFDNNKMLSSVRLPHKGCSFGLTNDRWYGEYYAPLFSGCTSLKSIEIPNGLTVASENQGMAPLGAPSLESVSFADDVSSIPPGLFANCSKLKSVNIPDSVKLIGGYAFYNCESLSFVKLPANGCEVGGFTKGKSQYRASLFQGCTSLKQLIIPAGINVTDTDNSISFDFGTKMEYTAGGPGAIGAPSLCEVSFADGIETIPKSLFSYCPSLSTITLPDSIKTIGSFAFTACTNLSDVKLPQSTCTLGQGLFTGCESLTTLTLPKEISVASDLDYYNIRWTKTGILDAPNLVNASINNGCTDIPELLFANCQSLEFVEMPDSLKSIGRRAFADCSALSAISLPDSVKKIGSYTFENCISLNSVVLPKKGCEIGTTSKSDKDERGTVYASIFSGCSSLKYLEIPSGLGYPANTTNLYGGMFEGPAIEEVTFTDNFSKLAEGMFRECTALKSVNLPNAVTSIPDNSFYDCLALSAIKLPPNCAQ